MVLGCLNLGNPLQIRGRHDKTLGHDKITEAEKSSRFWGPHFFWHRFQPPKSVKFPNGFFFQEFGKFVEYLFTVATFFQRPGAF